AWRSGWRCCTCWPRGRRSERCSFARPLPGCWCDGVAAHSSQAGANRGSGVKVLVTGGAGVIGSHLGEALIEGGHQVTALDDLSTGNRANLGALEGHERFRLVDGTIVDPELVERLMAEAELCFHLAAA